MPETGGTSSILKTLETSIPDMRKLKLPGRDASRPRLDENDVKLIQEIGIGGVKEQARRIVNHKLDAPKNDGAQTPVAGNPVYKAMHACNAASREQLSMAHRIPEDKELDDSQVDSIVNLLTRWVVREYNFYIEEHREKQRNLGDF